MTEILWKKAALKSLKHTFDFITMGQMTYVWFRLLKVLYKEQYFLQCMYVIKIPQT